MSRATRRRAAFGLALFLLAGCGARDGNAAGGAAAGNTNVRARASLPEVGVGGALMMQTATFHFVTTDAAGSPLVRGAFTLPWPVAEGQVVRGSWESRYVGPRSTTRPGEELRAVGPQVGRGSVTAEREGNEVRMNLNPEMADNNVTLQATVDGDALVGRWDYATFAGIAATGGFEAQRQP